MSIVLEQIVASTGLPESYVRPKLEKLLCEAGFDPSEVQIDQIREVLCDLLQTLILNEDHEGFFNPHDQ